MISRIWTAKNRLRNTFASRLTAAGISLVLVAFYPKNIIKLANILPEWGCILIPPPVMEMR